MEEPRYIFWQFYQSLTTPGVIWAGHIAENGTALYQEVCKRDLEGVICQEKRQRLFVTRACWLKVKNPDYTQAEGRREMFEKLRQP
jgi:hypothetical protein